MEVWTSVRFDNEGYELAEHRHLVDPWPRRSPIHGAEVDGRPVMVKIGGREMAVRRVLSTYTVNELGKGSRGRAWRLQLEDYSRVVVFHEDHVRWLLAQ